MTYPLRALSCLLWRMLTIRYQRDPMSWEGALELLDLDGVLASPINGGPILSLYLGGNRNLPCRMVKASKPSMA
ncbi:hypothetical protein GGQ89_003544 [Sphingomonas yabuuchiae]|uniref:Uncharacterized protein n=1 Tax=Sphingomonas yabuuchiae TaxID=172044 RepID=A0ABR6KE81_9SPHN|nr:hypothetical protein [Sphingomonas yabuuchiae]